MSNHDIVITTITILIIFINLGLSKPTNKDVDETVMKNSSILLVLPKQAKEYGDHYLCTAQKIEGTMYLTEFATVFNWGANHKSLLYACGSPAVEEESVWPCGRMLSSIDESIRNHENFNEAHKDICKYGNTHEMLLYSAGDENGKEGTPLKLPKDVSFQVGEGTEYGYLVLLVYYGNSVFYHSGASVFGDYPGITYLYQTEPTRYSAEVMKIMHDGVLRPDSKVPVNENVLDIVCDPVSMPRHKTVTAFAYRVHSHSRGVLVSGFRMRGLSNQEWTLIGAKSPQEEQRFYPITMPIRILPDDYIIAECQFSNPSNETILLGTGIERDMCIMHIMYYFDRDNEETKFWEKFCVNFGPTRITDMTALLGEIPQWVQKSSHLILTDDDRMNE